jgi:hypothetical protein
MSITRMLKISTKLFKINNLQIISRPTRFAHTNQQKRLTCDALESVRKRLPDRLPATRFVKVLDNFAVPF